MRRNRLRTIAAVGGISLLVLISAAIAFLFDSSRGSNDGALAVVFGAMFATVGWTVNAWLTYSNFKRQHTITFINTRFTASVFNDHLLAFNLAYPISAAVRVTPERMDELNGATDEASVRLGTTIKFILNYFEFVAVGMIQDDLDLELVEETLISNLIYYFDRAEPFIRDMASRDPNAFSNLIAVRDHYRGR